MDHSSHRIIATGKCFSVGWQSYIYEVVEADGGRKGSEPGLFRAKERE
jgi:hypothetical protein